MKRKTEYVKYAKVAGVSVILVGAGVLGGFALDNPTQVDVESLKATAFANGVDSVVIPTIDIDEIKTEAYAEGVASVNITVPEPVIQIQEIESENLDLVLDEIYDNDGSVEYLTDDLDDDELYKIADRIIFINEAKDMAIDHVKNELADELDNVEVTMKDNSTVELDEDDFEKLRLDDDADEVLVSNVDYEDNDVDVTVTGRFRHDDVWFTFEARVQVEDNEVDDFDILDVQEE